MEILSTSKVKSLKSWHYLVKIYFKVKTLTMMKLLSQYLSKINTCNKLTDNDRSVCENPVSQLEFSNVVNKTKMWCG